MVIRFFRLVLLRNSGEAVVKSFPWQQATTVLFLFVSSRPGIAASALFSFYLKRLSARPFLQGDPDSLFSFSFV